MIELRPGESGYFSSPTDNLDYHLFDTDETLLPDVRALLNSYLLAYLGIRYRNPESWVMAWLAGSGISYQWSAGRGNGDLDVLFGIDYNKFVTDNPEFSYMERPEIAEYIDNDLKRVLWKQTAVVPINGQNYEVTFYLNDNVEATPNSITNIHPYAAYNITLDEWTVRPPKLPKDPRILYSQEFERAVEDDRAATEALLGRWNGLLRDGSSIHPNSPQARNNELHRELVRSQARTLYDTIHLGRKYAFTPSGEGYFDFSNYRWQSAKGNGVVNALREILGE